MGKVKDKLKKGDIVITPKGKMEVVLLTTGYVYCMAGFKMDVFKTSELLPTDGYKVEFSEGVDIPESDISPNQTEMNFKTK